MNKLSQKVELFANLLIIIVALLLVGVIAKRYLFGNPISAEQPPRIEPTVGKVVNLPNENFADQPKTVILALQTTCHFCNESAPFYKRLVEATKDKNVKIVAVFPQSVEEATAHLNQLGISGIEVKQAPISALDASGTPTLVLTNQKGEVMKYWIGKLPQDKEQEVINQIIF
ncbi:MAG: redoxin domain-containing protein [Acidobacteriota bacterium]|nr:redoxin domain-containing protein [Acidobacteriota bacterium]